MSQAIINITIDTEGSTEIAVTGAPGPNCKALTEELEKALGNTVKDEKTREYNAPAVNNQSQRVQHHG